MVRYDGEQRTCESLRPLFKTGRHSSTWDQHTGALHQIVSLQGLLPRLSFNTDANSPYGRCRLGRAGFWHIERNADFFSRLRAFRFSRSEPAMKVRQQSGQQP